MSKKKRKKEQWKKYRRKEEKSGVHERPTEVSVVEEGLRMERKLEKGRSGSCQLQCPSERALAGQ